MQQAQAGRQPRRRLATGFYLTTINAFYLKRNRPTISQLVREVRTNCVSAGLPPPHRRTIIARLEDIDLQRRAKRRGENKIVKATTAVPGSFEVSRPLEVVQVDHTKADIFVVDEETRQPIGRPWLTLAMDVCSRMVTGFYLTMEAPSRLSTSLCLLHSVFDKSAWLREREIAEPGQSPACRRCCMSTTALTSAAGHSREDARMPASRSNGAPLASRASGGTSNV